MPPRYAYWTILVDNQPTAFRSSSQEELMPTFNRLKQKNASVEMKWWQNGKLWDSRVDAQEAMIARGQMGRKGDFRQREALSKRHSGGRPEWRASKGSSFGAPREERDSSGKLGWKPKGEFTPAPPKADWKPKGGYKTDRPARPEWKSKSRDEKPAWKPKSSFKSDRPSKPDWKSRDEKPAWKPKGKFTSDRPARPDWKSKSRDDRSRRSAKPEWQSKPQAPAFAKATAGRPGPKSRAKLDWAPKGDAPPAPREKRKWIPKEEYKRTQAPSPKSQAPRDKNWRPGGAHKDPRQKYKDAKKAKWGRFKDAIRKRWESKQGKKKGD